MRSDFACSVLMLVVPLSRRQVEVMVFGGQREATVDDLTNVANRGSGRLKMTYNRTAGTYTFEGWIAELMTYGRVMPDATLLPNGKVIILNGANVSGEAGVGGSIVTLGRGTEPGSFLYVEWFLPHLFLSLFEWR